MNIDHIHLILVPLLRPLIDAMNAERKDQYRTAPIVAGNLDFLGDSITRASDWATAQMTEVDFSLVDRTGG